MILKGSGKTNINFVIFVFPLPFLLYSLEKAIVHSTGVC